MKEPNVIIVIPSEYVRPSESHEDAMVLDMPATYAQGLSDFMSGVVRERLAEIRVELSSQTIEAKHEVADKTKTEISRHEADLPLVGTG
jgi:hypothetical protein